jgi:hypothetical protein
VRVRAKATDEGYGLWSGTLNTDTGIATVNSLDTGSATVVTDNYFDLSGESILDPFDALGAGVAQAVSGTYGGTTIRSLGGTILPFIDFRYSVASRWDNTGGGDNSTYLEVQRTGATGTVTVDDVTVSSYSNYGGYDVAAPIVHTMARLPAIGLGSPDDPGLGVWKYDIKVTVTCNCQGANASFLAIQPLSLNIEILEMRN